MTADIPQTSMLSPAEVAKYLRVSNMTVYRLIEQGELRAYRVGRTYRISPEFLAAFMSRADTAPEPEPAPAPEIEREDMSRPDIDEIAVERAIKGDRSIRLNRDETTEAIRQLTDRGLSVNAIRERLGVSERTVTRYRREQGVAA